MYYLCTALIEATDDKTENGNNEGYTRRKDFIEQIRNYNNSFPNGYPRLLDIIIEKFYSMLKQPY